MNLLRKLETSALLGCGTSLLAPIANYFVFGDFFWSGFLGVLVVFMGAFLLCRGVIEIISDTCADQDFFECVFAGPVAMIVGLALFFGSMSDTHPIPF